MTAVFTLVRAAHFLALMIVFGAESLQALFGAFLAAPPRQALSRRRLAVASGTALATALLWFGLTAVQAGGSWNAAVDPQTLSVIAQQTSFGPILLARIGLCALLLLASFVSPLRLVRVVLSAVALAAIALTSHAAASGSTYVVARAASDGVHLLASGFWIGGLAVLVPLAAANRKTPLALAAPLGVFSLAGTVAVALLIASGTANAIMILYAGPAHWARGYMLLLALKLVLAGLMVALALSNRFGLMPDIAKGRAEAADTLLGSVITEFVTGALIVFIVGLLGLMAPLMD